MRVAVFLAIAALPGAACARDAIDGVIGDLEPFDLDVVVGDEHVTIWTRTEANPICAPLARFPRPGECIETTDYGCIVGPKACLQRVALERQGDEIVSAALEVVLPAISMHDPELFARGELDLVIQGCGGAARIPLGRRVAPPPIIIDVATDGTSVRGPIAPTGATSTMAVASTGFSGRICHELGDAAWRVAPLYVLPYRVDLRLASIVEAPAVTTPWGEARIFDQTYSPDTTAIVLPVHLADRWELGEQNGESSVAVDGGPPATGGARFTWGFRDTPAGLRLYAYGAGVDYIAGETTDTLYLTRSDGRFAGTFPHVTPTNDLELSLAGDQRVDITVGPVTLTHESNPALTHQVSVVLGWEHAVVPRPEP